MNLIEITNEEQLIELAITKLYGALSILCAFTFMVTLILVVLIKFTNDKEIIKILSIITLIFLFVMVIPILISLYQIHLWKTNPNGMISDLIERMIQCIKITIPHLTTE